MYWSSLAWGCVVHRVHRTAMSHPVSPRRDRKKQQTRRALLDAAILLFAERGIHGTRIEDITERVDLGKGAFYNYFPSKDALIADIVAEGVQTFDDDYLTRLEGVVDGEERIRELARLHAAFLAERPRQAVLFHQARGLLMIKKTRVEGLRAVFADYLRRVGRALVVDADAWPEEVLVDFAAALVGGLAGYRSYRIASSAMPDSEGTVQEIMMRALPSMMQERLRCA